MRFTLIDLFIAIVFVAMGCIGFNLTAQSMGFIFPQQRDSTLLGIVPGVFLYVLLSPPIYRFFGFLPLFLPVCPNCRRRPASYHILKAEKTRTLVACSQCLQETELWWEKPATLDISLTTPSLLLVWPQSIGRWRNVSTTEAESDLSEK